LLLNNYGDKHIAGAFIILGGLMNTIEAVMIIEEGDDHSEKQVLEAWQYLIDTGVVWNFQGWYGRTAAALIRDGICKPSQQQTDYCEACGCTPCDCGWGNY
tara:strand:+ start:740 stop:1042 length:303 start_codon:yes stop_codon:yes gene_type:complete